MINLLSLSGTFDDPSPWKPTFEPSLKCAGHPSGYFTRSSSIVVQVTVLVKKNDGVGWFKGEAREERADNEEEDDEERERAMR